MYGESSYNSYPYRRPFVTIHDVIHQDGEARLSSAQLLTPPVLRALVTSLMPTAALEVLPEHVIARGPETLVWWCPAQARTMFFTDRGRDAGLRGLNGKIYPQPPLLFKSSSNHLWIRALSRNKRPDPQTKICMAPYWNCYDNASVCTGSMKVPQAKAIAETMREWETAFFSSEFSHAAGVAKHTRYRGGVLAMWKSLQGKKPFPTRYLVPLDETVEQFVSSDDHSYRNQGRA